PETGGVRGGVRRNERSAAADAAGGRLLGDRTAERRLLPLRCECRRRRGRAGITASRQWLCAAAAAREHPGRDRAEITRQRSRAAASERRRAGGVAASNTRRRDLVRG